MTATARLKQLLFMAASLALIVVGLTGLATAAQADDTQPCVPTEDQVVTEWFETDPGAPWVATGNSRVKTEGTDPTYTDWVNDGDVIRTETNVAPGADGDLVRYVPAGTVDDSTEGHWDNTAVTFYTWTGGNSGDAPPVYADGTQTALNAGWNATNGNPQGGPHAAAALYSPYEVGNGPNTASWFLKAGRFVPGVADTDYLWQKQVRTLVPGTDDVLEYEYSKTIEGVDCPEPSVCPEGTDNAGQVIPEGETEETFCTDEEESPWVCHPVEGNGELGNGWNLIAPNQASSHIDEALYPDGEYWMHETSDGRHDIYSVDGQTCPDRPAVCPEGTDNAGQVIPEGETEESFCDEEEPAICPEGTEKAGQVIPEGETEESFCGEDQGPVLCPAGTDKAGEEIPEGEDAEEFCDDDEDEVCPDGTDNAGQEIPGGETEGEFCDEDPIVDPGDGEDPGNNPGDDPGANPGNNPASNPQGSNLPSSGVAPAAAPGAQVPSAVNAGLAPDRQELTGTGGLGLGMSIALLGLGMVGLTLRPRRGRRLAG